MNIGSRTLEYQGRGKGPTEACGTHYLWLNSLGFFSSEKQTNKQKNPVCQEAQSVADFLLYDTKIYSKMF